MTLIMKLLKWSLILMERLQEYRSDLKSSPFEKQIKIPISFLVFNAIYF